VQDAPRFEDLGAKFNEGWLAHWINDPHSIRPHSLMPRVFPGEPGKVDQRAADLAAFLSSLGHRDDPPTSAEKAPQGGAIFANLGCIACHTTPDFTGTDEHDRIPLSHVKAKWQSRALRTYLDNPAGRYASARMPHFRLTPDETESLTAYLLSGQQREFSDTPKGDVTRGAQLLVSANCLNCHAGSPPTSTLKLSDTLKSGWTKGCMAPDATTRGAAPDFNLAPEERDALLAFAAGGFDSLKQEPPIEYAARQIQNLRCTACHGLDGKPGTWSKLEDEMAPLLVAVVGSDTPAAEGAPVPPWRPPALTWVGEKLTTDWMAKFIAGDASEKPRPWLASRMPGFAAPTKQIAEGLAFAHGLSTAREERGARALPERIAAGAKLVGADGGFNCVQCHAVGAHPPTAPFEAPGINFASIPGRLRHDYAIRWMLAPTRIDPDTKMPKFSEDGVSTPLTEVLEGKTREQFEAIWEYLQTLK
jgi:mono/diheme cytochrome c family protein